MRVPRAPAALALACLLLAAAPARAGTEVGLIDLLGPSLGAMDGLLSGLEHLARPGAPLDPLAPILLPAIDLGRLAVEALRVFAQATVLGATDGDIGHGAGTPDEVGVATEERVLVDGVAVPGQDVHTPGHVIVVATPGIDRTIVTPPVGVPPLSVLIPGGRVDVAVPPLGVPPVTLRTPPVEVATPPIVAPPVRVATPAVSVPAQNLSVDLRGADVTVQELRGTLYVGPVEVPYSVGPHTVGQSLLPEEVPRTLDAETPGADVLPAMVLVDEPARTLVPSQSVSVQAQEVPVTDGAEVFPGQHVASVEVPPQELATPGVDVLPSQQVPVHVAPVHVADVEVPAQHVSTPTLVVTEEQVVLPALDHRLDPFGDLDDVGYVGYGRDGDSSLYPYACTAVVGCLSARPLMEPYVRYADRTLGAALDLLDGPLVVR